LATKGETDFWKGLEEMSSGYWSKIARARISRRRAIAATSAVAASTAFLAACGGDDEGSSGSQEPSGVVSKPEDTTSSARAGGTLKDFQTSDIVTMDALASNDAPAVNQVSVFAYPRMLKFKSFKSPEVGDYSVEGDTATSYEMSPDKLTITFKLRQGMKWDSRAPTNGRPIDAQDVVWSWSKFGRLNGSSANHVYNADTSPGAPVESVTAPDDQTVIYKLRKPDASEIVLLATWDQFYVMPRESESQFDPRREVRGHGPWLLDEYVPSAFINWHKNPDYYVKDRPFFERLERPIIPEYSARLAQFRSGKVHTTVVNAADIIQTKQDLPDTQVLMADFFATTASPYIGFGYEGNSPFKDARVRRAVSMGIDREGFANALDNLDKFRAGGIDVDIGYNTVVGAGWTDYWLNPYDEKNFGPSHQYLKYNLDEAKKQLSAAGANGAAFDLFYNQDGLFGAPYAATLEVYTALLNDLGLRPNLRGVNYQQYNEVHYSHLKRSIYGLTGGFNGMVLIAERPYATVASLLFGVAHRDGVASTAPRPTASTLPMVIPNSTTTSTRSGKRPTKSGRYRLRTMRSGITPTSRIWCPGR
jgi:ABC-type transport system substrate-binding protein